LDEHFIVEYFCRVHHSIERINVPISRMPEKDPKLLGKQFIVKPCWIRGIGGKPVKRVRILASHAASILKPMEEVFKFGKELADTHGMVKVKHIQERYSLE